MRLTRRELVGGAVACAGLAACGHRTPPTDGDTGVCSTPSDGTDAQYCLTVARVIRVAGGGRLAKGEAVLAALDDNTAVIVVRDTDGVHALSAICTHACCIVALCRDASCAGLTPTPADACGTTEVVSGDPDVAGVVCPCHGSTFRLADGAPLSGPATTALPSYAVELDGDDALVDTGRTVDPSARI